MEGLDNSDADAADELIAMFGKITTSDRDSLVEQFARILQVDRGVATFFLEASSWSVEKAVHAYLNSLEGGPVGRNGGGGGGGGATPTGGMEPPLVMLDTPPQAQFMSDLTMLAQPVPPGTTIDMQWVFRNTGTEPWPANSRIVFVEGDPMSGRTALSVPRVLPQADVMIPQRIRAPTEEGTFTGVWRLVSPAGYFGEPLWLILTVKAPVLDFSHPSSMSASVNGFYAPTNGGGHPSQAGGANAGNGPDDMEL